MTHTRRVLTASDLSTGDTLERCVVTGDCTGLVCTAFMCDLTGAAGISGWTLDKCALPTEPEPADIKVQAAQILEQIKPLAYQDPGAVKEAVKETFTEQERAGVGIAVVE